MVGASRNSGATACIPPHIAGGSAAGSIQSRRESSGAVPATSPIASENSFRFSSRAAAITPAKPRCCSSLLASRPAIEGTLLSGQDWTCLSSKGNEGTPSLLLSWINVFLTTYGAGSMPQGSHIGSAFLSLPQLLGAALPDDVLCERGDGGQPIDSFEAFDVTLRCS